MTLFLSGTQHFNCFFVKIKVKGFQKFTHVGMKKGIIITITQGRGSGGKSGPDYPGPRL